MAKGTRLDFHGLQVFFEYLKGYFVKKQDYITDVQIDSLFENTWGDIKQYAWGELKSANYTWGDIRTDPELKREEVEE